MSEVGGGIVAGFKDKNIVLVEDEDGFEIPMALNDVVVVGEEDYSTANVVAPKPTPKAQPAPVQKPVEPKPVTFVEERRGGDQLSAYLAFVPIDIHELTHTRFEAYLVNDSNYFLHYTYLSAEGNAWRLRSTGEIEPNTKLFLEEFGREQLSELERVGVQLVAYKRQKTFALKPAADIQLRIDGVKFYKLHTFRENDFFEQPALLYTIIENDATSRPLVVDAKQLKQSLYGQKDTEEKRPSQSEKERPSDMVVVDLHAEKLLETTAGLEPADILDYQLDIFRRTLKLYAKHSGQKIVFIHGKGEGVLRRAIVNDLNYRYKQYSYQDASFREYGYGATQVTIKNK